MTDRLTPSSARLNVNPILSETARGYRHPEYIWNTLFPRVDVTYRGGRRVEFDKNSFIPRDTRRAPGAAAKEVRFGYDGANYTLEDHSLDAKVTQEELEESRAVPSMQHAQRASNQTMQLLELGLEVDAATLATTPANHTNTSALAGNDQWDDYVNSEPAVAIEDAAETIRSKIGMRPNTLILGASVASKLMQHPDVIERIKYTQRGVATMADLQAYFGIPNFHVGGAVQTTAIDGAFSDVWGKVAILAYVARGTVSREEPSFGYTYTLRGHPRVYQRYWDQKTRSWVYPHDYVRAPLIVGAEAAYLYTAVIS